jgi:Tol biopolymer transport system component
VSWQFVPTRLTELRGDPDPEASQRVGTITVRSSDASRSDLTTGNNPDWSPDGTWIAFDRARGVRVVNAAGGGEASVTSGEDPDWQSCHGPDLSPCIPRLPRR